MVNRPFIRVVTIAFAALMLAGVAIIASVEQGTGLRAWLDRLNDSHREAQQKRRVVSPSAARTAKREAAELGYEHGHLATQSPAAFREHGYASRDVLLAIKLDPLPAESMPVSYLCRSLYTGRVRWTAHADNDGWLLLPVPTDCGEGQIMKRIERVVVYAPDRTQANRGRVLFDGIPPELVMCK